MISRSQTAMAHQGKWDVIVIGAGPAGAMSAYLSARRGLRTLLIEKQVFPRYKVCGGCLNAKALQILREVGLDHLCDTVRASHVDRLRVFSSGRSARIELPPGRSVSRKTFDAALVAHAVEAGVEFRDGMKAQVCPAGELHGLRTVQLESETARKTLVAAKVVLAADGLAHPSLSQLDDFQVRIGNNSYVGLGMSLEIDASDSSIEPNTITMSLGRHGYIGRVLAEGNTLNVATAVSRNALKTLGLEKLMASIMTDAGTHDIVDFRQKWVGTRSLTCQSTRVGDERLFLVGDATGYVEPFTGEGMAWALASAQAVLPLTELACTRWHPDLIRMWGRQQQQFSRDQRLCRLLSQFLRYPFLSTSAVSMLERYPGLASPFVGCIHHTNTKQKAPH